MFNAANEAAVSLFLDGRIRFRDIGAAIASALDAFGDLPGDSSRGHPRRGFRRAPIRPGTVCMLAILAPILVFGLVIFVHELGHFLAAKAVGVYAPRFSIGFGPALFRRRRGETEYVLALLPLGGYVRMASRHDAETAFLEGGTEEQTARAANDPGYDPNAMIPFGPKPVPEDRWFESKPLWARIVIMIAGVVMNVVLAVVVATMLAYHYGQLVYPGDGHRRSVGRPRGAPELAQLQSGDTIRAVNGVAGQHAGTTCERGSPAARARSRSRRSAARCAFRSARDKGSADDIADGLVYYLAAGHRHGVSGRAAPHRPGFSTATRSSTSLGNPCARGATWSIRLGSRLSGRSRSSIRRGAATDTIVVTPKSAQEPDPVDRNGDDRRTDRRGSARPVASRDARVRRGDVERVCASRRRTPARCSRSCATSAAASVSVRELGGPIAITRASVTAARSGIDELFYLIALLSINVAVLNLLPIPILDGGQILINVLESAKGSPFSMRTRDYILRFGLIAIALLFAIVMYNDTRAGFAKLFGWVGTVLVYGA